MPETVLTSLEQARLELAAVSRVLLFKHSPICPVSLAAREQYERFRAGQPAVPTLFVDVIGQRAVARGLATEVGVAHASPQVILFVDGKPVFHASHGDITVPRLTQAWADAAG